MGDHHQKVQKVPEDQREDVNQEVQSHTQNLVKLKKKTQILLKKLQHKKENIQKEQNIQKVLTIHTPKVVNIHMENMEEHIILEKSLVHIILEEKLHIHIKSKRGTRKCSKENMENTRSMLNIQKLHKK